ncbi:MAG: CoA activase [Spirochaetes bacterium]|nr:CoA activase [Spirochaetota bacterium]
MDYKNLVLGIDIGSVTISVVLIDQNRNIIFSKYEPHHGHMEKSLKKTLNKLDLSKVKSAACTNSTPESVKCTKRYNDQIAIITICKELYKNVGSILIIGGEKYGLILFDENGNYINYKINTSCAAGTGSFLDQQAARLNLKNTKELGLIAFKNKERLPQIASRCAVFAMTDLIHAQQEGYTFQEISDGLCYGLAKNIYSTLFAADKIRTPIIMAGGVSRNQGVIKHLNRLIGENLIINENSHLFGALGAANLLLNEYDSVKKNKNINVESIIGKNKKKTKHYYKPLKLKLSEYPIFSSLEKNNYHVTNKLMTTVETDIYEDIPKKINVYLGIDIGSTSTKAVLVSADKKILAGFYTETAGRPLDAAQSIFEAIDDIITRKKIKLNIMGAGTTGSGRKFIGIIIGADQIIDEITTHARAAYELKPETDTIIEIGGQDSKFTTLKDGIVTFSIMNNVCAAGTGSFIAEQAKKFGCPLEEYAERTDSMRAPISSDQCTVFMERDMNRYLSQGYSIDETLTSVLHSIRDNYLTKVAIESSIGDVICFQGATAKNRSLVAAFEQKLIKPIFVSKFCHLTGALGAALLLIDEGITKSSFKGINIYRKKINITNEVCTLCTNHCKITLAELNGEKAAYGFLCGRDYNTKKFVNNNTSGFDLLQTRKKLYGFLKKTLKDSDEITIGLPAGLHVTEELSMWEMFFDQLGIKTIKSDRFENAIDEGKKLTNVEFCTPLLAFHGHIRYLMDKADYIFAPIYLEKREKHKGRKRKYCYYTQLSVALIKNMNENSKILSPLIHYKYNQKFIDKELFKMLKDKTRRKIQLWEITKAFKKSLDFQKKCRYELKQKFREIISMSNDINIMFLSRPYILLSPFMNKGIPDIFSSRGIKTFYHDMIPYDDENVKVIEPLLNEIHWHYAADILEASEVTAATKNLYPVLITSFHCSPDSFLIDYFKRIMNIHKKPYLILQLDDHCSNVGYETRIEAAIRSFRNHSNFAIQNIGNKILTETPKFNKNLKDKTLVLPNFDFLTCELMASNLQNEGIDARVLDETEELIKKSLRHNTGQCIPMNIIAEEFIDYVQKNNLTPEDTILWLPASDYACNIKLFPYNIRQALKDYGQGMEKSEVYLGNLSFYELSIKAFFNTYFAFMFAGILRKLSCKIRPYELIKGETDKTIYESLQLFKKAFLGKLSKESAAEKAVELFKKIKVKDKTYPKVAVFGDFYARDNEILNQNLIRFIENLGGEVITTSYNEIVKMTAGAYFRRWYLTGRYLDIVANSTMLKTINIIEEKYIKIFEPVLNATKSSYDKSAEEILKDFNVIIENVGETPDNLIVLSYLKDNYPDIKLFVQATPALCCASLITESMSRKIEKKTGIPVVSIIYDGTGSPKNDVLIPFIKYMKTR